MALGALTLSVTQGVRGRPFSAAIQGLTTGKVEIVNDGSPGFSTVNGRVSSTALPYDTNVLVLREYDPGAATSVRESRIDITTIAAPVFSISPDGTTTYLGSGAPVAKSASVPSATGAVYTIGRMLGSSSTLSLIAGTNGNLSLAGGAISATAAIGAGASQTAVVREVSGQLAVEYPVVLTAATGTPTPTPTPTPSPSWRIIGQYNERAINFQGTNASSVQRFSRMRIKAPVPLTAVRVCERSFYHSAANGDVALGNDYTARHAIVKGGAKIADIGTYVVVPAGQGLFQAAELTVSLAAGDVFYLDKERRVTSGQQGGAQTIPYTAGTIPTGTGTAFSDGTTSYLGTASPPTATSGTMEAPTLLGYGVHTGNALGVNGDSITYTNSDGTVAGGAATQSFGDGWPSGVDGRTLQAGGWFRRAVAAASVTAGYEIPYSVNATPSATMQTQRSTGTLTRQVVPYVTHWYDALGTNDLNGGRTAAQLIQDKKDEYAALLALNPALKIIPCTILPRVPGHGSTAPTIGDAIVAVNAAIRSGALTGSAGYLDNNKAVALSTDERLWADVNDEYDGTHPTTQGQAKIAAAVAPVLAQANPWTAFS